MNAALRMTTVLAACCLASMTLLAQTSASLNGTVTLVGQALPGVTVTIASPALQGARRTVTGDGGAYDFPTLPPGTYEIAFEKPGMERLTRAASLQLAHTTRIDAVMSVAGVRETVSVSANAPPALSTPEVATNLTLRQIDRLPVQRNQLATAQFAPGVTGNTLTNGQLQISGGPGYDNLVLINGVAVTENVRGQMRPMYVEDAIAETTLLTGAVSAEYGRFTGGVVSTITRSGGNDISGSIRDSLTNPRWSAQTPALEDRPDTLNHVTEATLGGFVLRDRLWFFAAGRRARNDTARQTIGVPAFTGTPGSTASVPISYSEANDQKRYEGKLTAQPAAGHSLVGTWFRIDTSDANSRVSNNIYDLASLSLSTTPESLQALHYDGVLTPEFLLEGQYSKRTFKSTAGAVFTDLVRGTPLFDRSNSNARFNSPGLCGVCDSEQRNSNDDLIKASWFLNTKSFGSHEIAAGADRFEERHYADNHQSGSDFSLFVSRAQWKDGVLYPVITPTTATGGGAFLRWTPILSAAQANRLRTDSVFLNDKWNAGARWSVSIGVRLDRNDATDAGGLVSSDDRRITPRVSVHYDIGGTGRQRLSASYAEYASHIVDGIASANQSAGNAAAIDFAYKGPAINDKALTVSVPDAIQLLFGYFNSNQGGTGNIAAGNLRPNGSRAVPGYTAYFDGSLSSPYVREITVGYGEQIGAAGFARIDLIDRDWRDFYSASVTTATRRVTTPLGIPVDLALYRNSNAIQRAYRGIQLQARQRVARLDLGLYYTYATLRGNDEGETVASGPVAGTDPAAYYPEFLHYRQFAPIGYLQGDQRHRVRVWADYDVPMRSSLGRLSVSLLHSFDSALPYSAVAPINVTGYAGAPANPGYNAIPNGQYYFSGRGQFRVDDINSTSLAVRYSHAFWRSAEVFGQADLLNISNRAGVADPSRIGTTVSTAANSSAFQPFNPFTQAPVQCPTGAVAQVCRDMGANYQFASNFGKPLNDLAYQTPRTYRFSLGLRF
ncbi:MAG TPA: carboxypeptidase regulatory-like domain-containing protein [Thermoanaerobaculia bacterium]|nr:carboxypeptidase regulatory-like domain-containing protein [Thermoanaerobaculia bacterium]